VPTGSNLPLLGIVAVLAFHKLTRSVLAGITVGKVARVIVLTLVGGGGVGGVNRIGTMTGPTLFILVLLGIATPLKSSSNISKRFSYPMFSKI
jgi:hypothetical protein